MNKERKKKRQRTTRKGTFIHEKKKSEEHGRLTKEDDLDVWPTFATFSLVDLNLSINFVVDPLRLAFVREPLLALCGSLSGKVPQRGPLRVDLLEVDGGRALKDGIRRFLLSLLVFLGFLGGTVVECHG